MGQSRRGAAQGGQAPLVFDSRGTEASNRGVRASFSRVLSRPQRRLIILSARNQGGCRDKNGRGQMPRCGHYLPMASRPRSHPFRIITPVAGLSFHFRPDNGGERHCNRVEPSFSLSARFIHSRSVYCIPCLDVSLRLDHPPRDCVGLNGFRSYSVAENEEGKRESEPEKEVQRAESERTRLRHRFRFFLLGEPSSRVISFVLMEMNIFGERLPPRA